MHKCVVTNCTSGYTKALKKPIFHFPEDMELRTSGFILLIQANGQQLQIQLFT